MVFSEDEALYVDFLSEEKQPGPHVRRINGIDEADDDQLLAYWEDIISEVPTDERTGRWHIAYCLALPTGQTATSGVDHPILFFSPPSETRIPGWPMSSIEGSVRFGKPNSEYTEEERTLSKEIAEEEILLKVKELIASQKAM